MKVQGWSSYSSTLSLTSAIDVVGGQLPCPRHFTPRKDPVPVVQEAAWAPGPVWTGAENLVPTGIQSPDRAAHSACWRQLFLFQECSTFK